MTFESLDEGARYRLTHAEQGIVLEVSRLRRQYQNLVGELAVSCGLLGTRNVDGVISVANFNLSEARARRDRAQILSANSRTNKIDWLTLLETLCQRVLAAERQGTPAVVLSDLPRPTPDAEHDVDGFRVPSAHASILFGDGGTLKSMTALQVAGRLVNAGHRVALIDWELDQWTHRLRIERLFGTVMPGVRYVRCDRPLVHEVDRLWRITQHEELDFAIFDSCGFACDGPPEAAESALDYFRAVRHLGVGSLHIAHTTKNGETSEHRPFGSAFWHNSARSTWFVKQAAISPDGQVITIGLFNRKANLGPLRPPVAFDVNFMQERTVFTRVDVADVDELAASIPLWQRIRRELTSGKPKTFSELSALLDVKVDTVEKAVKRRGAVFTRVKSDDGIHRIALVERRAS